MLIIKLGGSVFVPKNSNFFDEKYLKNLKKILEKVDKKIILIHWTWNFGHSFVKKYWINKKTFSLFLKAREKFFRKIDKIFFDYERILARKVLKVWEKILKNKKNIIISWDVLNKTFEVISSDVIFSKLIKNTNWTKIILTDVDWVFDEKWEIIKNLSLKNLDKIKFWGKENDVTWAMKSKLESLKNYIWEDKVFLCNGKNLKNLKNFLEKQKGKWTYIYN